MVEEIFHWRNEGRHMKWYIKRIFCYLKSEMLICSIDVFVCLFFLELKGPLNADFLICSYP